MGKIPKFQDSTLGDENKGFQALANKKAMQNGTMKAPTPPPTTTSMQDALKGLAQQPQQFADGGEVPSPISDPLINGGFQMPSGPAASAPTPPAPMPASGDDSDSDADQSASLQAITAALSKTPDTNPNIYQGMTADDRLALQKQLMSKMSSGGNLIAQGLGGIGDAVSNSFGGKNTNFQQNIMKNNQQQMENSLNAVDTARAQRLQDVQGNQQAQLSDPNSAMSQSMRKTLQSAGLKVPSGMSGDIMLKVAGPLGELAMKQATLGLQQQQVNNTTANQNSERVLQAIKDKQDMGITGALKDKLLNGGAASKALDAEISEGNNSQPAGHGIPDLGSTFNGQKVIGVKRIS